MKDQSVRKVVQYVADQCITTTRFQVGLNTKTQASFHMEQPEAVEVIAYILKKESCTADEAVQTFTEVRDKAVKARAQSPKRLNFFMGLLLAFVIALVPCVIAMAMELDFGVYVPLVLLAAGLALFFYLVLRLAWNPRRRAMDKVWKEQLPLSDKLEKLYELQASSLLQIVFEHTKAAGIAFAVIALAVILGVPAARGVDLAEKDAFHREMSAVTVSAENNGSRYVVYMKDDQRYVSRYLDADKQAASADDVRAVIRLDEGTTVVGRYENGGNAYKRHVTIELVDQRTGVVVAKRTVSGSEPPRSISVKEGSKQGGYGSHPAEDDIMRTIRDMIQQFENQ